jgi:HEAT repeat protein
MRKRVHIVLAVLLVAVAGVIAWLGLRQREPVYQGKRLSVWLQGYEFGVEAPEIDAAVRKVGTNAIPYLLPMLRAKDHPALLKWWAFANRHPALARFVEKHPSLDYTRAETRHLRAVRAFEALGDDAKDAVPELIEMYREGIAEPTPFGPSSALSAIGPAAESAVPVLLKNLASGDSGMREGAAGTLGGIHSRAELVVPALQKALNDAASAVGFAAAKSLGLYGERARPAVPALLEKLKDPYPPMGAVAAEALGRIHDESGFVVPRLLDLLHAPDSLWRQNAAWALYEIGPDAKEAVSALTQCLNDQEAAVREAATNALKTIDPEAAAKAGVR